MKDEVELLLPKFDLQAWYLHIERIESLVGPIDLEQPDSIGETAELVARNKLHRAIKNAILSRLDRAPPPSLESLILTETLNPGAACLTYRQFRSKGLTSRVFLGKKRDALPKLVSTIRLSNRDDFSLEIPLSIDRLTSNSAFSHLQRRNSYLLTIGFVESVDSQMIHLLPCVIASVIESEFLRIEIEPLSPEIHVDCIDSFHLIKNEPRPGRLELKILEEIPEKEVKAAIGRILGEQHIPKDWGGETADLYSSHLMINGTRQSASFLLKGPSKFKPLEIKDLGKNGDQGLRLFKATSSIKIVQHCHEVTESVRDLLYALSNQIHCPRRYCVIDGYDTIRLLRAYSECGLTPTICHT